MCTLTFFPSNTGAILTHNRDEHALRKPATLPKVYHRNGVQIIYPTDGQAGGSWIGLSHRKSICLLNGAFISHIPQPPYKMSRGIVLLDAFGFESMDRFMHDYQFQNIEPFTMIEFDHEEKKLHALRWTGNDVFLELTDLKPTIWSSSTLYNSDEQKQREELFEDFLSSYQTYTEENIRQFHETGHTGNIETSLVMQRANGVKTLSISQISSNNGLTFYYEDKVTAQTAYLDLVHEN